MELHEAIAIRRGNTWYDNKRMKEAQRIILEAAERLKEVRDSNFILARELALKPLPSETKEEDNVVP